MVGDDVYSTAVTKGGPRYRIRVAGALECLFPSVAGKPILYCTLCPNPFSAVYSLELSNGRNKNFTYGVPCPTYADATRTPPPSSELSPVLLRYSLYCTVLVQADDEITSDRTLSVRIFTIYPDSESDRQVTASQSSFKILHESTGYIVKSAW